MARRRSSRTLPIVPGARRSNLSPGTGIGAETPKKASPQVLSGLGMRVLKLLDARDVPKEPQATRSLQDIIRDGNVIVLLAADSGERNFTLQTADTKQEATTLFEWSKDAKTQRVTDDQSVRTRFAVEDIINMGAVLDELEEVDGAQNG